MRRKCRIWWPIELSATEPTSSFFLFGWFTSSSLSSLDIVVAFACDEVSFSPNQSGLQGILHETNGSLSASLQDKCTFSFLGHCALDLSSNGQLMAIGLDEDDQINTIHSNASTGSFHNMLMEKNKIWSCGCRKIDGSLDHSSMVFGEENNWVQLVYGSHGYTGRKIRWIPKLHHIHWHGQTVSRFDLHVILYETPMFGSHHFSVGSSEQVKTPLKKPKWVEELHEKQPLLDLESVVMAVNSANSAKLCFEKLVGSKRSTVWFSIVCLCVTLTWQLLAMFIASLSTLFYIVFQFLHVLCSGSQSWMYLTLGKVFSNTIKNIQFRCSQILYWPILLKDNVLRSQSCVEFAEKAALHKHSMWSSVATEIFLGYTFGIALFFHAESVCLWASNSANNSTNYLLRNGCVWLMGVPAGFKLNTELARVLGMLSLNAIQIWSTLWFFVGSVFIYFVKGLAILGVLFGVTTPAALIMDMILLATLHVSTLHWLISHLYSYQIQALAAFSRLFRGQKWNPLRERYDSYDYTVEQHIVGSLLFTPLLLLLPTTSVFYIFFTILKSTISFTCLSIDIVISIIRATPYIKLLLWLVRPRRFPCGIWFEIISCQSNGVEPLDIDRLSDTCTPSEKSWQTTDTSGTRPSVLVSILQSNFLNIGQIVWPHYREVFSVVSGSFVASSAYGVLTGRRIPPSTLGTGLPSMMPWTFIPYKEYWRICYDSVFACKADAHRDSFQ
ncbi:N-acetylglucosaminyl-phosphatidylinositol biosynthetic protein like [Actinidia chinensis var. chinensis]|uniref:N-acetylglucosaminyl-phosphatidylinositol biosynthetic protein like n=1 Tax=Actinidia chinensis var. chinensis TaxID=1590841 RepID=A0A2R6Q4F2_ACTCC|nr:N-acetylglucosaminyl-phosphatidylinositol biosynthetic protein like [Actinidia chinensis var. chinensis]